MATASTRIRPEPSPADLHAAWERSRRATWPATYDEAMADATLSRIVRINALHPAPRITPAPAITAARRVRAWQPPALPTGGIDRKRAASGERDDD